MNYSNVASLSKPGGLSTTALIMALASFLSLVLFFVFDVGAVFLFVCLFGGLLGLIFAIVALAKKQKKGPAITALVLSILMLIVSAGLFLFALIFVGFF